jgi:hypothetical protein
MGLATRGKRSIWCPGHGKSKKEISLKPSTVKEGVQENVWTEKKRSTSRDGEGRDRDSEQARCCAIFDRRREELLLSTMRKMLLLQQIRYIMHFATNLIFDY